MRTTFDNEVGLGILSLDAGSLAGVLSQMHILSEFMSRLGIAEGIEGDLLPADHFDLIGGSGIAAFAALCIGPLKMTAGEAIEALLVLGLSVFYERRHSPRGTIFDSDDLRDTVCNIIEGAGCSPDTVIGNLDPKSRSKCVWFVSPIQDIGSCHRLRSYRGRKGMLQCTVLEVALASLSTLGLFDPAEIGTSRRKYTSAGMHCSNPIKVVLDEAEQIFGKERRVACLLSLGSGTGSQVTMPSNLAHLEAHSLLQAMDMQQKITTEEVARQYGSLEAYYRFSVEGIGSGSLNDWINWDADHVERYSRKYLNTAAQLIELAAAVEQHRETRGTVTLGGLNSATGAAVTAKTVPPVTPFFVLRQKPWRFMEQNLARAPMDNQIIFLLSGLGGSGKSTLLSYYAEMHKAKYSQIFLIDGSSAQTIKTDLQNAVRSLGPEHSQKTWEGALQYFEQDGPNKNWLICFDNADDPALSIGEFIPKSEHGTIFITSRNRDLCFLTTTNLHWELGPMTREEALDALLRSAQRATSPSDTDTRDGATLVDRLGGLALAVVQAGVYCFQKSASTGGVKVPFMFRQYLDELDKNQSDLMKYPAAQSLDQYGKSVYQSLNMSYSALPQLTRDFLHLCGYFHQSNIALSMFESAVEGRFRYPDGTSPNDPNPTVVNRLADLLQAPGKSTTIHLHKIVFSLKMFSFVVTSMTTHSVMLNYHTLVHAWSRDIISPSQQQLYSAMATRVIVTSSDDKYYLVHSSLTPHVQTILKESIDIQSNDMGAFAQVLVRARMGRDLEALYRRMYDLSVREHGKDSPESSIVLDNLATSIREQGRYKEAAKIGQDILEVKEKTGVQRYDDFLGTEFNLAETYALQGRNSDAEPMLLKLLPKVKKKFGSACALARQIMTSLANVYTALERDAAAMELRQELFETCSRVHGPDHPDTLMAKNNLAISYMSFQRLDEAQSLIEETLRKSIETKGKEHPEVLNAKNNLSSIHCMRGNFAEAATLAEEGLEIRIRVHGKKHPETWRNMGMLAELYYRMGRRQEGVRLQVELRKLEGAKGVFSRALVDFIRRRYEEAGITDHRLDLLNMMAEL